MTLHRLTLAADGFDLSQLHQRHPRRYPFLLESVAAHPQSGRWDILFAEPGESLVGRRGQLEADGLALNGSDFFAELDRWVAREAPAPPDASLPFVGGWFFLLGYEAVRWVEPKLQLPDSPHALPDALAVRCRAALIHDRERNQLHLISESGAAALARLSDEVEDVRAAAAADPQDWIANDVVEQLPQQFTDGVSRILEWLRAGDVFQINLSRPWDAVIPDEVCPAVLYRRLRLTNPAPFAGIARWGDSAVISSSPERLLQINGRMAQTRPIAEHVMLIDLERNDLGRVCEPGSIEVSELMSLESYAHVHHIVSNVRGQLRADVGPGAALRAVFPGGTITGCPKVRAMQIIAELEGEGRGPYTGSMGYPSRDGRMDSKILIRSLVWQAGRLRLRTGAGIVADSDPQAELEETRAKARGLLLALGRSA